MTLCIHGYTCMARFDSFLHLLHPRGKRFHTCSGTVVANDDAVLEFVGTWLHRRHGWPCL
jgi:hypothetical protein